MFSTIDLVFPTLVMVFLTIDSVFPTVDSHHYSVSSPLILCSLRSLLDWMFPTLVHIIGIIIKWNLQQMDQALPLNAETLKKSLK